MKKILLFMAALIVAAACAAPPTNRDAALTTNQNTSGDGPPVAMTEADAIAKEKAIWETIKVKDYDAFAAMLATDQVEVLPDGVMDKAGSIAGVKQFEPSEVNFSDWRYLPIDKDAFVVVYTVNVKGKYQGREFPPESARSSSAWVYRDGKWLAIYHQECPVKPPMAAPASSPDVARAAASPATTPATVPATGPDPIANEKIVWDLFKSKNYDAFAALLAPESVEVETDNVYDKAGSIKGVQTFDASKVVLSDWKTANFDADAALVTYTVMNPAPGFPPEGERHSTIWVRRDAKWLALFHHGGTPVRKAAPSPLVSPSAARPASSPTSSPALKTP
jgi:hypothetical protein